MMVAGLHSLHDLKKADGRHVFLVDVDGVSWGLEFRSRLVCAMKSYRVNFVWVFKTGGGLHIVSPCLADFKTVFAFHRQVGGDALHRKASVDRNGFVLRLESKSPEPNNFPLFVELVTLGETYDRRLVSAPVWDLFKVLKPTAFENTTLNLGIFDFGLSRVRIEAYEVG